MPVWPSGANAEGFLAFGFQFVGGGTTISLSGGTEANSEIEWSNFSANNGAWTIDNAGAQSSVTNTRIGLCMGGCNVQLEDASGSDDVLVEVKLAGNYGGCHSTPGLPTDVSMPWAVSFGSSPTNLRVFVYLKNPGGATRSLTLLNAEIFGLFA